MEVYIVYETDYYDIHEIYKNGFLKRYHAERYIRKMINNHILYQENDRVKRIKDKTYSLKIFTDDMKKGKITAEGYYTKKGKEEIIKNSRKFYEIHKIYIKNTYKGLNYESTYCK